VVSSDKFFGGDNWVEQWRMHRPEDGDPPRRGEEATSPSHGLERRAMEVAIAAIALPASDRQQKIDTNLIGQARA
jgi:hypothetical protein